MLQYWLTWVRNLRNEEGQDLAEYALLIALVALGVIGAVTLLGGGISGTFTDIATELGAVIPAG